MLNNENLTAGEIVVHFNPATGRIIRTVEILSIRGEAAEVRAINGKNKGTEYPVATDKLTRV